MVHMRSVSVFRAFSFLVLGTAALALLAAGQEKSILEKEKERMALNRKFDRHQLRAKKESDAASVSTTGQAGAFRLDRLSPGQTVIVLPAAARQNEDERFAARELQSYLKKSLGIELRIISETPGAGGFRGFHVGSTQALEAAGIVFGPSESDEIIIDVAANTVLVAGNRPVATRYAVYRFLDRFLGVRWYLPTAFGEIIPTRPSLTVEPGRIRESAAFDYRNFAYTASGRTSSYAGDADSIHRGDVWAARNLLSVERKSRSTGSGHNLSTIFDPGRSYAIHPEVFPLHEGRRYRPRTELTEIEAAHFSQDPNWQPCFSHPQSVRLAVDAARRHFDAHPEEDAFSLAINDSYSPQSAWCTCQPCLEANGPERSFHGLRVWSNAYFRFVNAVAREIAVSHPGRKIGALAYLNVESPPDYPLEKNVTVWLTQDTAQYHDREYEGADRIALARWSQVCRDLAKYDYYSLQWNLPRYFPEEIRRDLNFAASLGLKKYHIEDVPAWHLTGPMLWIAARLLWDPGQNVQELQTDFCRDLFGPAAEEMNRFFVMLQETWQTPRPGRWFEGLADIRTQLRLYPTERIRSLAAVLDRAARLAGSGPGAERVAFFQRGWRTCLLLGEERDLAEQLGQMLLEDLQPEPALMKLADDLKRATELRRAGFEAIYAEPLLGGSTEWAIKGLKRAARWDAWLESLGRKAVIWRSPQNSIPSPSGTTRTSRRSSISSTWP